MKKLSVILLLLFLIACTNQVNGERQTNCTLPAEVLNDTNETMISIESDADDILVWTTYTTLTRAEFDYKFLQDIQLSDAEIYELFTYNQSDSEGIAFQLARLNEDYVIVAIVYDYLVIASERLNEMWNVDDFEYLVTLSSVLARLEDIGAVCVSD